MSEHKVEPIPSGFHTITPYLTVRGGNQALDFYKKAFGAEVLEHHNTPDGKVMHALFRIGDSNVMLSDEYPPEQGCGMVAPSAATGVSVAIHLYVKDVDSTFNQAVKAGAKVILPVEDMFWGDRYGQLEDPFGHRWAVSTHKEDLSEEEVNEKAKECCASKKK